MAVWLGEDGSVLYQHYEKPVASKLVISERSAHSNSSKRSVHINELTRRMYNTSRDLSWDDYVAPVLSDYLGRMMAAGYSEKYRKDVLQNALRVYDDKCKKNDDNIEPLNRPKDYKKIERRKEKKQKKKYWSSKGKYSAPIIIPSTPGGVLHKMLKEVAESEPDIKFKIVEKGGIALEKTLSRPNPTASEGCGRAECEGCKQEGGMRNCQKCNCLYSYTCMEPGCKSVYIGESHNNFMTKSAQHKDKFHSRSKDESFIHKHQVSKHGGQPPNMKMKVLKTFRDNLTRQITESVYIFSTEQQTEFELMNSKSEWHAPSLYTVRREIGHG